MNDQNYLEQRADTIQQRFFNRGARISKQDFDFVVDVLQEVANHFAIKKPQ